MASSCKSQYPRLQRSHMCNQIVVCERHCWLGQQHNKLVNMFPCRTDFTCCNKEHSYNYGNDNHHDIGLAFNDKVGTCDCKSLRHVA